MSALFKVDFDVADFRRAYSKAIRKQIPFAFSLALNETAKDAQDALRASLPGTFTIRSGWTSKGIRVERSSKRHLVARVGSVDSYMGLQAEGGTEQRSQAVPVRARRNKRQRTPRSRWPRALIQRKGAFIADLGSGPAVYMPSRHKDPKRRRLRLMYRLVDEVRIPPRWSFDSVVAKTLKAEWRGNVRRALRRALRSARP